MKQKFMLLFVWLVGIFSFYAAVHESVQSNGDKYFYYVPDSPSAPSGNGENGGNGGGQGENSGGGGGTDSASGTGENHGGGGISAEQAAEIAAKEIEAREAENSLTEATKKYIERQDKIKDLQKLLEKGRDVTVAKGKKIKVALCNQEKDALKNYISYQESLLNMAYKEVSKKADATTAIYNSLGELYAKYETTGDPVKVSTGEYVLEYEDFVAQDFLDKFRIKRNLIHTGYSESFGYNWTSSLDSRIIRCCSPSLQEEIDSLRQLIAEYDEIISICDEYNEAHPKHPDDDLDNTKEVAIEKKEMYQEKLEEMLQMEAQNNKLIELNKYSAYGPYSLMENCLGSEDYIILIDENGLEIILKWNGEYWVPMGELSASRFVVYSLDVHNMTIKKKIPTGGYCMVCQDGSKEFFSKYGIPAFKVDRNGNKTFFESTDGKISAVKLKTGEVINISRNSLGFITKVSGSCSGSAAFSYIGNKLTSAIDSEGIKVSFLYDDDNSLLSILKSDGNSINISYEMNNGKKVVSSVTDECGSKESFYIDFSEKRMKRTSASGFYDVSKFDDSGNVLSVIDSSGNNLSFTYNQSGLIACARKNGRSLYYQYDERFNLVEIQDDDGIVQKYEYNSFNQITRITDADGFSNSYSYDMNGNLTASYFCGNLCGTYWYYSNGLLKGYSENGITVEFEYNAYGSPTKMTEIKSDGSMNSVIWEYDLKNRLIKSSDSAGFDEEISYGNDSETIRNGNGKKTVNYFDSRKRLVKTEETDLLRNITYEEKYAYDGRGNITSITLNGKVFAEYSYTPEYKLKSYLVWNNPQDNFLKRQGIKTLFSYDSAGRISEEKKECVTDASSSGSICVSSTPLTIKKYKYTKKSDSTLVSVEFGDLQGTSFVYDNLGRLTKRIYPDGYEKIYSYSKAGRLLSIRDSNLNLQSYQYKSSGGGIISFSKAGSIRETYEYFSNGLLKCIKDSSGIAKNFAYNSDGNLISEKGRSYQTSFSYDKKGREKSFCVKNHLGQTEYEYQVDYNDKEGTETIKHGDKAFRFIRRDAWGRIIEQNDLDGHFYYAYDILGNCISQKDFTGKETLYGYAPFGWLARISDGGAIVTESMYDVSGRLLSQKKNNRFLERNKYNNSGRLIERFNQYGGRTSFEYNSAGKISKVSSYDTGEFLYGNYSSKAFSITDANGYKYLYTLSSDGSINSEKNPLGKSSDCTFDNKGRLINKKNFSGSLEEYIYDDSNNSVIVKYGNGEIKTIKKNVIGMITNLKNAYSELEFSYDSFGHLIKQSDKKADFTLNYKYDSFGRCIEKKANNFDIFYYYDDCGRPVKAEDSVSGVWIKLEYDSLSRVVKKSYSNGIVTSFTYNQYGETESLVSKDRSGQIISADFILYDSYGRISAVCNKNGEFSLFDYDESARLQHTNYPYSEEWEGFYKKEAEECGFSLKEGLSGMKKTLVIPYDKVSAVNSIIDKAGCQSFIHAKSLQDSWEEYYTYTAAGSISSVKNNLCVIHYEYDCLNRLVSKYADNTQSGGIRFKWNDDGCLESLNGITSDVIFHYGAECRPVRIEVRNKVSGEGLLYEYTYDALGRRCSETINGGDIHRFVYDGFSNSLLCNEMMMKNGAVASDYYSFNNQNDNQQYRIADTNGYSEYGSVRTVESDFNLQRNNERSYHILCLGDNSSIVIYDDGFYGSGKDVEYIVTDYHGRSVCRYDDNSGNNHSIFYDTWGNSLKSDYYSELWFSTDFGFRDYNPFMKSFTTRDPAERGMNMFAFCACDPVNYFDEEGFSKQAYSNSQNAQYAAAVLQFTKFNKSGYMDGDMIRSMGLPLCYDCADTSTCIDYLACLAANLPITSDITKAFGDLYAKGEFVASKWVTSSAQYAAENGVSQSCSGYDRDYLRHNEFRKEEKYKTELEKKKAVEEYLKDPKCITPGSCLLWKNSDTPMPNSPERCGHVATVLSRQFDADGKVCGFIFIQGHTGGSRTELCFMSTSDLVAGDRLDSYFGCFCGLYENENSGKEPKKTAAEKKSDGGEETKKEENKKDSGCGK
ncbi:MAG: hypothetical protein IJ688_03070 [Treponema sp.]|nr:hypothetical protein [Treponema sp.]